MSGRSGTSAPGPPGPPASEPVLEDGVAQQLEASNERQTMDLTGNTEDVSHILLHVIPVAAQLEASGERERLKALLRERLVECGWREDVTRHAREFVAGAKGHKVTADDIVAAVRPRGRQRVPDHVKAELLTELRSSIVK